jgi:hypothetical protein
MPQLGDVVLVGFDSNSDARILGYDAISYELLTKLQEEENITFFDLQPGEFDSKSSGNAYIKGDRLGVLLLAGGLQSIVLDKQRRELVVKASTHKEVLDASISRLGVAKRTSTTNSSDVVAKRGFGVPAEPNGATASAPNLYEKTVDLRQVTTGVPFGTPMAFESLGDVLDPDVDEIEQGNWGAAGPAGVKQMRATGQFVRALLRVYDSTPNGTALGTPGPVGGSAKRPFEYAIDVLGNVVVNQGQLASAGVFAYLPISVELQTLLFTLHTATAKLGDKNTATEPVVCGNLFLDATSTFMTAHATYIAAVEAWSAAVTAYNVAVGGAFATAGSGSGLITPAIAATMAAAATAYGLAEVNFAAATTTFNAAISAYVTAVTNALSKAVFVSLNPGVLQPTSEKQI